MLKNLPCHCNLVICDLMGELDEMDKRITQYDQLIVRIARQDERAQCRGRCTCGSSKDRL